MVLKTVKINNPTITIQRPESMQIYVFISPAGEILEYMVSVHLI